MIISGPQIKWLISDFEIYSGVHSFQRRNKNIKLNINAFNFIHFIFQYSLFSKKESGHEDAIWSCAWGEKKGSNKEKIGQNDEDENDEDQNETGPNLDHSELIVVTGGVDDLVKIWAYDDGALSCLLYTSPSPRD